VITYIAFMRAINVGGHQIIKMDALSRMFTAAGCANVRTYIQSGNVAFDAPTAEPQSVAARIANQLHQSLGYEVTLVALPLSELAAMVKSDPFKRIPSGPDVALCATFMATEPARKPKLPLIWEKELIEVFDFRRQTVFSFSRRKANGWFGFPNQFIEKEFAALGTTRKWNTVVKIVDLALASEANSRANRSSKKAKPANKES